MDLVLKRYVHFIIQLFTVMCATVGTKSSPHKAAIWSSIYHPKFRDS